MNIMAKNMGVVDRAVRALAGVGLIAFALSGDATGYEWLGWIGVVPLITAFMGSCPLYSIIGVKTSAG